jgi:hypothetical protein
VESASLEPFRSKFIAGGDDMWVRLFDFHTGDEIGMKHLSSNHRFQSNKICNRKIIVQQSIYSALGYIFKLKEMQANIVNID